MSDYDLTHGYPADADITTFLSNLPIELVQENDPNYYSRFKQQQFGILNAIRAFMSLSVYCPSSTTFNVRGGYYYFGGTLKTYMPGSAVDPTDNDTTYIWITESNTISSAVDGTGWPSTDHLKLAEIDVDSDGVITDVRDLRAQGFLRTLLAPGDLREVSSNIGVPFILTATLSAGSTVQIYNADAPYKLRIIDAWSIAKSADGGTWKLTDGSNDITDTVAVTSTDETIDRVGTIDDGEYEIDSGGSLSVVGDGANADVEVYIMAVRVS